MSLLFGAPKFTDVHESIEAASLSVEEKNDAVADIFGTHISSVPSHSSIAKHLENLEYELQNIPPDEKSALVEAKRRFPQFFTKKENLVSFLQRDNFDEKLAVERLARYWEFREHVFGERAYEPLTIESSLRDDIEQLHMGYLRLLPGTDSIGRAIICFDPSKLVAGKYTIDGQLRVFWYLIHSAMERPNVMYRGFVTVHSSKNVRLIQMDNGRKLWRKLVFSVDCLPLHLRCLHYCHPPSNGWFFEMILPIIRYTIGRDLRNRFLVHKGTDQKVLHTLKNLYGISPDQIPTEMSGAYHMKDFYAWLDERSAKEQ